MDVAAGARRILLMDDDAELRRRTGVILERAGYRVHSTRAHPSRPPGGEPPDALMVAVDWKLEENGPRISSLKELCGGAPVIVLVDPTDVGQGVDALQHGAEDYMIRPPDPGELRMRLERIFDHRELDSKVAYFHNELSKKSVQKSLEARSPAMQAALERVYRVAPRRSTVLIYGESGAGKELIARSIHFNSPRREHPFIALNCAAMPANLIESELFGHERGSFTGAHARTRGKFEIAHRGSLFLDEIGEMEPTTQAKLLRVLEEREFMRLGGSQSIRVDVRVIAATNADLEALVSRGEFRQDLYYRLKVVSINVPPLRHRREDIPSLVSIFLDELSRANAVSQKVVTPEALEALKGYQWPGNVRELKNFVESMLVSVPGEAIHFQDLPPAIRQAGPSSSTPDYSPGTTLAEMEAELIRRTLERTGGNRTHSATLLGIGVRTLQRKIRTYGISIAPKRRRPRRKHSL